MSKAHPEPPLAVVTGSASGIGAACVDRLRADGFEVVGIDRDDSTTPVDVTDADAVNAVFDGLDRAPEVVVLAAGIGDGGPLLDLDPATWRKVMSVNLDGTFLCLQAAGRRMAAAGRGSIIVITSINDRWPLRTAAAYCSSKAAVSMLVKVAALELGPAGVRVNGVAPGPTMTPLVAGALEHPRVAAAMAERTPLGGRPGTVEEIADVVALLGAAGTRWVTGHIVVADGGQLLMGEPDVAALLS